MTTHLGETIKRLRKQNNITQAQLAQALSVGRPTIAGYETKGKQPDYEKLLMLSQYFNVSIDALLNNTVHGYSSDTIRSTAFLDAKNTYTHNLFDANDHNDLYRSFQTLREQLDLNQCVYKGTPLNTATVLAIKNALDALSNLIEALNQLPIHKNDS